MYLISTPNRIRFFLWIGLTILISTASFAQKSKEQLEKERKINLRKIEESQKILKETESRKSNTLGQLNALNQQLMIRRELVNSMKSEVQLITKDLGETESLIASLESDLDSLKEEYGAMVYSAYKARSSDNIIMFLLASNSFNQLARRIQYLEQYSAARNDQIKEINLVTQVLQMEIQSLQMKKEEQDKLIADQLEEQKALENTRKKQQKVVAQLNSRAKDLRNDIASRKKSNKRLADEINKIIKAEIAARKKTKTNTATATAAAALSSTFAGSKANLGWPVSTGFISIRYGKQAHPANKRLIYENNGIDIQTQANEKIRTVFKGTVSAVVTIPGMNNAVFVRHGEYLTVYANLRTVNVKVGDQLENNQVIGEVFTNRDGLSELHFEIWKNTTHLNPSSWLAKR